MEIRKQQDSLTKFVLDEQMELRNKQRQSTLAEKERETKRLTEMTAQDAEKAAKREAAMQAAKRTAQIEILKFNEGLSCESLLIHLNVLERFPSTFQFFDSG